MLKPFAKPQYTPVVPELGRSRQRLFRKGALVLLPFAIVVLLVMFFAQACEQLAGGRIRSEDDFREQVAQAKAEGVEAFSRLRPAPSLGSHTPGRSVAEAAHKEEGSSSCVDDFGFDRSGVTRDETSFMWELRFESSHDYVTAVERFREDSLKRGWRVEDIDIPEGSRGDELPGVRATDDRGIELSLRPHWWKGQPVLLADSGCIRYHYRL
ncbi:hypothetical protein ABZZ80_05000 [Streptomyces sp. NPDC006356]